MFHTLPVSTAMACQSFVASMCLNLDLSIVSALRPEVPSLGILFFIRSFNIALHAATRDAFRSFHAGVVWSFDCFRTATEVSSVISVLRFQEHVTIPVFLCRKFYLQCFHTVILTRLFILVM